jgi:hypothetical protein
MTLNMMTYIKLIMMKRTISIHAYKKGSGKERHEE